LRGRALCVVAIDEAPGRAPGRALKNRDPGLESFAALAGIYTGFLGHRRRPGVRFSVHMAVASASEGPVLPGLRSSIISLTVGLFQVSDTVVRSKVADPGRRLN